MKIDAKELRAAADAHEQRLASPLWTPSDREQGNSWLDSFASSTPAGPSLESAPLTRRRTQSGDEDEWEPENQPRLESRERAVETLTDRLKRRPAGSEDVPGWLESAAGDPHDYDSPDASRTAVCARVLPSTYHRLRSIQRRIGLRTTAAAWEMLLRLGIAAAERLPTR